MPIQMYDEWLKESQKVDPQSPAVQPAPTQQATPGSEAPPTEDIPLEMPSDLPADDQSTEDSPISELEEFEQIDTTRREAIKAFKVKQQEFMNIPIETRNNPVTDEDKTKVESLKAELQNLNSAMKEAVSAYDTFNDKMLGSTPEVEEEP